MRGGLVAPLNPLLHEALKLFPLFRRIRLGSARASSASPCALRVRCPDAIAGCVPALRSSTCSPARVARRQAQLTFQQHAKFPAHRSIVRIGSRCLRIVGTIRIIQRRGLCGSMLLVCGRLITSVAAAATAWGRVRRCGRAPRRSRCPQGKSPAWAQTIFQTFTVLPPLDPKTRAALPRRLCDKSTSLVVVVMFAPIDDIGVAGRDEQERDQNHGERNARDDRPPEARAQSAERSAAGCDLQWARTRCSNANGTRSAGDWPWRRAVSLSSASFI